VYTELLNQTKTLLSNEGFKNLVAHKSTHTWSLSGNKGDVKVLVHITEQDDLPHLAQRSETVPAAESILMRAGLPGLFGTAPGPIVGVTATPVFAGSSGGPKSATTNSREIAARLATVEKALGELKKRQ
jgi:hypothetical protein